MARPKSAAANPAATEKATAISTSTRSAKAAKRRARGFQRFRSGLLNFTPKGRELELVQQNQQSILLSLPPEIRSLIWKYALGGRTIKVDFLPRRLMNRTQGRELSNRNTLLQVCRQIYSEAAQLPYQMNTFDFRAWSLADFYSNQLWPFQRDAIASIKIGGSGSDVPMVARIVAGFSNLKHIGIRRRLLLTAQLDDEQVEEVMLDRIRSYIGKDRFDFLQIEFENESF